MRRSKHDLFRWSALYALTLSGMTAMPFIVVDVSRYGLGTSAGSVVAGMEILGIATYSLLLAHKRPPPCGGLGKACMPMLAGLLLTELASAFLHAAVALAAVRFAAGLAEGALFNELAVSVAHARHAERLWGRITLLGGLGTSVLLFAIAFFETVREPVSVFLTLAAFVLLLALVVVLSPGAFADDGNLALTDAVRPQGLQGLQRWQGCRRRSLALSGQMTGKLAILLAIVMTNAAQASQWAVSAYRGTDASLSTDVTAWVLAVTSAAGMVGALVPACSAGYRSRLPMMASSFIIMGIAIYGFLSFPGRASFAAGQFFANAGFYSVVPFLSGWLTEWDVDGALIRYALLAALFGAASGTAIAGPLLAHWGGRRFALLCTGLVAAALMLSVGALRREKNDGKRGNQRD